MPHKKVKAGMKNLNFKRCWYYFMLLIKKIYDDTQITKTMNTPHREKVISDYEIFFPFSLQSLQQHTSCMLNDGIEVPFP